MDLDSLRWERIEALFHAALELPADARGAFLAAQTDGDVALRREVEGLLTAHGADPMTAAVLDDASGAADEPADPDLAPGSCLDRYRLVRQIGAGGMGQVFEAEQRMPVRRRVALKVIKRGMDTQQVVARFALEQQALALMDHPAIATVFDAGTTPGGRPFFVMEYVDGVPINTFCDARRLTTRQRLALFCMVCEGVQHAHQKAVIHRDLKPSNVLVTYQGDTPVPKIIDFGVAKALGPAAEAQTLHTHAGMLLGTPAYMSPEQASLTSSDVDTRSDVYSLGIMLYELLVGSLPFEPARLRALTLAELQRVICEEDAPRPSTRLRHTGQDLARARAIAEARSTQLDGLTHALMRELDWIPLRAIAKDRDTRYATPQALADDCRRYLEGRPVTARPPSTTYLVSKFVRRHRSLVLATAGVVASLAAGAGISLWQADAARVARDAAQAAATRERAQRERADEVAAFQAALLQDFDLRAASATVRAGLIDAVRRSLLTAGTAPAQVEQHAETFARDLSRADLTDAIVQILTGQILAPAASDAQERFAADPASQAAILLSLATTHHHLGRLTDADALARRAAALYAGLDGYQREARAAQTRVGQILFDEREYEEAVAVFERLLDEPAAAGMTPDERITLEMNLVEPLVELRDFDRAGELIDRSLASVSAAPGDDALTALIWHRHGLLADRQERFAEALESYRRAWEIRERILGPRQAETVASLHAMAYMHEMLGNVSTAREMYEQVIAHEGAIYGERSNRRTQSMENLAILLAVTRTDMEASRRLFQDILDIRLASLGEFHPDTVMALGNLGVFYDLDKRDGAALEIAERVLRIREQTQGPMHPETLLARSNVGELYRQLKRLPEARAALEQTLRGRLEVLGPQARYTLSTRVSLTQTLLAIGDLPAALEAARDLCAQTRKAFADDLDKVIWGCAGEGVTRVFTGELTEGLDRLRVAVQTADAARRPALIADTRAYLDLVAADQPSSRRRELMAAWEAIIADDDETRQRTRQ